MARDPDAERRRLFDLYTHQLIAGGFTPAGVFLCPLCQDGFTRKALDGPAPLLSLAHIVPDALGGRRCTLTCTRCNNGNGNRLEADLAHAMRYEDWAAGGGDWDARLSGEFGDIGISFQRTADTSDWTMLCAPERTNPAHLQALEAWMAARAGNPAADITWTIRWSARRRPQHVAAAVLQSAYLMAFAHYGYDFAFNPRYDPVREQTIHPEVHTWAGRVAVLGKNTLDRLPDHRPGAVMFVFDPVPSVAVLLRFRPRDGRERVLGVFLPSPDDGDPLVPEYALGQFDGTVVPYRPELVRTRPWYFHELWRTLRREHEQRAGRPAAEEATDARQDRA